MPGLSLAEAARALGAAPPAADAPLRAVVTDSRELQAGDLFVALPGARTDGHCYLESVAAAGAAGAVVMPDKGARPPGLPVLVVPDPLAALGRLARYWLGRLRATVVGVTGTVGKTTAKDFLAFLLGGEQAGVHAAPASFNSEVGLPLAILGAPEQARLLVLEYGVNAPGEMERLLAVANPQHAWITAVTEAHLEGMGDLATIRREKCRLALAVPEAGTVWLSAALHAAISPSLAGCAGRVRAVHIAAGAGTSEVQILGGRPGAWRVKVNGCGEVLLPVLAPHEIELAGVAARMAQELGVSCELLRERLVRLRRPEGRLTRRSCGAWTVLDDSYNASPAAVSAALELLASWPEAAPRIAVLGAMRELGARSEALHREVGAEMARLGVDRCVAVGEAGAWIAAGAAAAGSPFLVERAADLAAAARLLAPSAGTPAVVLLKASRGERLERLLALLEQQERAPLGATATAVPAAQEPR